MNSLQKARCLLVGMVVATMATPLMACDSGGFWPMVFNDIREARQTQQAAVTHPIARPFARAVVPRPALGSPALGSRAWLLDRMGVHVRDQFGQ